MRKDAKTQEGHLASGGNLQLEQTEKTRKAQSRQEDIRRSLKKWDKEPVLGWVVTK